VVLPEATYLERLDPIHVLPGLVPEAVMRTPCIEPLFETRPNHWIMQQLAKRFGDEAAESFDFTMEEFIANQAKVHPGMLEALRTRGVYRQADEPAYGASRGKPLSTRSGKIELYSERYADEGLDPLPVYRAPEAPPRGRYRLLLGRTAFFTHGTTQNNPYLHELMAENALWLHPGEAARLGLRDGSRVRVRSSVGEEELPLKVTERIRPDCVYMDHGFGVLSKGQSRIYGKGASDAALLEDRMEPISGNVAMHQTFVEVFAA
jgi:thiosulfate reductase/polysulfide reductase chain A